MIRACDLQVAQEIGIDRVRRMSLAGSGVRDSASMPMRAITVRTRVRPILWPALRNRSRNIRAPANGEARCRASIRRLSAKSADDTGVGWSYAVERDRARI